MSGSIRSACSTPSWVTSDTVPPASWAHYWQTSDVHVAHAIYAPAGAAPVDVLVARGLLEGTTGADELRAAAAAERLKVR